MLPDGPPPTVLRPEGSSPGQRAGQQASFVLSIVQLDIRGHRADDVPIVVWRSAGFWAIILVRRSVTRRCSVTPVLEADTH
ncbi:hypothetical protein MRX96_030844 [Rhipicephalus microplus]